MENYFSGRKTELPGSDGYIPTVFVGADIARGKAAPKQRATKTSRQAGEILSPVIPCKRKPRRIFLDKSPPGRPKKPPKPTEDKKDDSKSVWVTTDHDYVKSKSIHGCQTETEYLREKVILLQDEVLVLKGQTLSLDSVKHFTKWTNLPNKAVFDGLARYLNSRGGSKLKYWKGKETNRHRHFADLGMANEPGPDRRMTFEEELFMVLVKLKTGFTNTELQQLFGMSETAVGQIFTTHLNFLYNELKLLFEMPDVEEGVAECYKEFPNLKVCHQLKVIYVYLSD